MINEQALRDTLVAFAINNKKTYKTCTTILDELAALRETVRALDPAFGEVLAQKRIDYQAATLKLVEETVRDYDSLIDKLKDGYVC